MTGDPIEECSRFASAVLSSGWPIVTRDVVQRVLVALEPL